jgi:hypothetical protein
MCGAPKSQTITQKTELDPNLQRLLYGGIFPGAPAAQPAAPMSDNGGGGSDDRDSNDMGGGSGSFASSGLRSCSRRCEPQTWKES